MHFRSLLRPLGVVALVALALVSGPAGLAHATDNSPGAQQRCTAGGYRWDPVNKECWNLWCPWSDGHYYHPGEVKYVNGQGYSCDGRTGQFVPLLVAQPAGPATGYWTPAPPSTHSTIPIGPLTTTTFNR